MKEFLAEREEEVRARRLGSRRPRGTPTTPRRSRQTPASIAARDPLAHGTLDAPVAYYRLPGPAGHKSRYEDPAIEKLAEIARSAKNKDATYVFTNVDMFADAKRFKKALKLGELPASLCVSRTQPRSRRRVRSQGQSPTTS